jgi:hypothetical protein
MAYENNNYSGCSHCKWKLNVLTTTALADMFGISTRSIRDLEKRGIIVRAGMLAVPATAATPDRA